VKKAILIAICAVSIVSAGSIGLFATLDAGGAIELTPKESFDCEFRNYDDSFLWTTKVYFGEDAQYGGGEPTRKEDQRYTYAFSAWDLPLTGIKANTVFHAQYFETAKFYKAIFQNYDHRNLFVDSVPYGGIPTYEGETPKRPQDDQYSYVFKDWDKPLDPLVEDTVFTATFDTAEREYNVTFYDTEDKVLYVDQVPYDGSASYVGVTPVKRSSVDIDYVFRGWDKKLDHVKEDFSTHPEFDEKKAEFEVRFVNYDETLLYTDHVSYGGTADYFGAMPIRPNDQQYHYEFSGWNLALNNITSNTTITARFYKKLRHFTVTFKNYDGTLLDSADVEYGHRAVYAGSQPSREQDEKYTYTFTGWDRDITNVTNDFETYAVYQQTLRKFNVVFNNFDGSFLYREEVEYGKTATYFGDTPVRTGDTLRSYRFKGWDKDLKNVTADTIFTAEFEEITDGGGKAKLLYVLFDNYDSTKLDADIVEKGEQAFYRGLALPKRERGNATYDFVFQNWDREEDMKSVQDDFVTFAQYTTSSGLVIVTYRGPSGELLYEDFVLPGSSSAYEGPAEDYLLRENRFIGWSQDLSSVKTSITVYPTWEKTTNA